MKYIKFAFFLFYRYYAKGKTFRIPFFSAVSAMVMLTYFHICQVLILLDKEFLLPFSKGETKMNKYIGMALFLLPLFLFYYMIFREDKIKTLKYSDKKIKRGYFVLIIYSVLSFVTIFILLGLKRYHR